MYMSVPEMGMMVESVAVRFVGALRVMFLRGRIDRDGLGDGYCCSCRILSEDSGIEVGISAPGGGAADAARSTLLSRSGYKKDRHAHHEYIFLRAVPCRNRYLGREVLSILFILCSSQLLDLRLSDPRS